MTEPDRPPGSTPGLPPPPPPDPGGSHVVISKIDGEVSFLPNFPPERAVELYHRHYRRPPS
ncbi:hypothetical protein [Streptomyces lydicus]|uniref:hypothetical protein n=1 Tax=Streptomyces lydicus TaxID=47763 RepID=UPI0010125167|nr:hypothetical protein [Streptomyces lydicus]MCZ1010093.1 hypothetical protein [Streptomyces lydicus]